VIEHLADYRKFVDECSRGASLPQGLLIVSSPNKNLLPESRGRSNRAKILFTSTSFEPEEFPTELSPLLSPHVQLLLQNRVESFAFSSNTHTFWPADARIDWRGWKMLQDAAHFLIGICRIRSASGLAIVCLRSKSRQSSCARNASNTFRLLEDQVGPEQKVVRRNAGRAGCFASNLLPQSRRKKWKARNRLGEKKLNVEIEKR